MQRQRDRDKQTPMPPEHHLVFQAQPLAPWCLTTFFTQDQLHNVWDSMHKEITGPLVQTRLRLSALAGVAQWSELQPAS